MNAAGLTFWVIGMAMAVSAAEKRTGPWDMNRLSAPPAVEWGSRTGRVQEVYFAGEPYQGRGTRVFGYLGRPDGAATAKPGSLPAMVLVHGGGGKAFPLWAEHWAQRGYVALAMDLSGNGPSGKLADGGPDQLDTVKFREFGDADVGDMWSYHAVAAVIRGHSFVRSLGEVDVRRVGITGISWGGYLTCIVAGVDSRFAVAVPVYGCGFLGDNSVWKDGALAKMSADSRSRWLSTFDPSQYLGRVRSPILFLNGTTDFAYPLDSYQKSYRRVPSRFRNLSVVVDLPHGHIWTFPEVDAFVDAALNKEPALAEVGESRVRNGTVRARVSGSLPIRSATLCYAAHEGPWQKRVWKSVPARVTGSRLEADLPADRPLVGFLAVVDGQGLRVSGEHFIVAEN